MSNTEIFIELIERIGFAELLRMTADACDVELDCIDANDDDPRQHECLTALRDHLIDVAREETWRREIR